MAPAPHPPLGGASFLAQGADYLPAGPVPTGQGPRHGGSLPFAIGCLAGEEDGLLHRTSQLAPGVLPTNSDVAVRPLRPGIALPVVYPGSLECHSLGHDPAEELFHTVHGVGDQLLIGGGRDRGSARPTVPGRERRVFRWERGPEGGKVTLTAEEEAGLVEPASLERFPERRSEPKHDLVHRAHVE